MQALLKKTTDFTFSSCDTWDTLQIPTVPHHTQGHHILTVRSTLDIPYWQWKTCNYLLYTLTLLKNTYAFRTKDLCNPASEKSSPIPHWLSSSEHHRHIAIALPSTLSFTFVTNSLQFFAIVFGVHCIATYVLECELLLRSLSNCLTPSVRWRLQRTEL